MIVMVNISFMNIGVSMAKKCEELKNELVSEILEKARVNYLDFQDKMLDSPQAEVWKNSEKICVYKNLLDYIHEELTEFPLEKLIYLRDGHLLDKLVEKHQKLYYGSTNKDFESLLNHYVEDVRREELSKDEEEME